ncbi:MAG: hypothetical protein ACKOAD_07205, partial [Gammaproteobacteria bacterium]
PAYQFFGEFHSKNSFVPDLFWVWDHNSHHAFKTNNDPSFLRYHKSFLGGMPWKLWQDAIPHKEKLSQKSFFDSSKIHILITMQPEVYGRNLWEKIIPIIKKNDKCYWWIRKHPCFYQYCNQLDDLNNCSYEHINFLDAYRLPIYTLLEHCDLHITTDSSSAIDADEFKVPTLFLSNLCYQLFPYLMAEKKCVYFESVTDIENYITSLTEKISKVAQ